MHPQIAKSTKIGYNVYDRSGNHLCRTFAEGEHGKQVATFIVRACNSHDALVEALEDAEFLLRKLGQISGPMQDSCNRSAADARETLKQAQQ